ncbi:MAG: M6 family metalloprotease domain-containing protein [Clostridia bacterium]|nr:M6 family metalloprotease domain-containing protein [Clostridia bacterium]
MYCKYCGNKVKYYDRYCSKCGKPIGAQAAESQSTNSSDVSSFEQTYQLNDGPTRPVRKKHTGLIIFLVLFFLAAFAFIGVIVFEIIRNAGDFIDEYADTEDDYWADEDIMEYEKAEKADSDDSDKGSLGIGGADSSYSGTQSGGELLSETPILTFLLSFNDEKMSSDALDWYDILYGEGYYETGSVDDYYRASSNGTFSFVPADETSGKSGDGIISLDLNMKHPSFNFSRSEDDYYSEGYDFFEQVLTMTDDYIDYGEYDKDGDGIIDPKELTVLFVFAGYEAYEEFDLDISTYSCSLEYDYYLEIDGVEIGECIYTAEKDPYNEEGDQIVAIGVLCHELGHAIDLPDLYDTDYSSEGLAFHCLMAGGCDNSIGYNPYGTTPAPLTAWEREYLGFIEPEVITSDGTYTLHARSSDEYNIVKIDDGDGYYLLENVDFDGFGEGLEMYLDSPGIAIWYVNKSVVSSSKRFYNNDINDNENEYGVMLIEANGTHNLYSANFNYQKTYDHYFYKGGDDEYTSASGINIEILDKPGDEMQVKITLP